MFETKTGQTVTDFEDPIQHSLGTTGRVIVSAAMVMFAVFVSFVSNPSPMVKQIGLGLAIGVLVDAIIVRLILVPSLMRLFGRAGWWLPRWLDWIIPNVSIEGGSSGDDDGDDGDGDEAEDVAVPVGAGTDG